MIMGQFDYLVISAGMLAAVGPVSIFPGHFLEHTGSFLE